MNAWKVILPTLVIFIAGVVTGGVMVKYGMAHKPEKQKITLIPSGVPGNPWTLRNKELLRRMDRELDLTPEQHKDIEQIIQTSQKRIQILLKPVAPQLNREMQEVRSEIAKELTSDQRKKFEGFNKPRGNNPRRMGTNAPANPPATNIVGTNATP